MKIKRLKPQIQDRLTEGRIYEAIRCMARDTFPGYYVLDDHGDKWYVELGEGYTSCELWEVLEEGEKPRSDLQELILSCLLDNDGLCMDNEREREILAYILAKEINK